MVRNFALILIVTIMTLFLGCQEDGVIIDDDDDFITAELGVQFQLKVNQTASIKAQDIEVKFLNVTEDSRCPSDVVCVWAGQVTVLVNVSKDDEDMGDLSLTDQSGNEALNTKTFDGYSIKLVKVDPYPISTKKIELKDYIATFIVTKK